MSQVVNIAGYKFVALDDCAALQAHFKAAHSALRGTILLSPEGINFMLAGEQTAIDAFTDYLRADGRFADIPLKTSYTRTQSFQRFLVKIKKEIITMRTPSIDPVHETAPHLAPKTFKQWLDEGKPMLILDTRNDYEIDMGKFHGALDLDLQTFGEFPERLDQLSPAFKQQTVVTYCTGGVRCEKAAAFMMQQGFTDVYQLDGGILNYFAECGGQYYDGHCYVFDERLAVDAQLASVQEGVNS